MRIFFFFKQLYGFVRSEGTLRSSCLTLCTVVTVEIRPASLPPRNLWAVTVHTPLREPVFWMSFTAVLLDTRLQRAASDACFSHPHSSKCAVCRGRAKTKFNILSQIKALYGYIYPPLKYVREGGSFWLSESLEGYPVDFFSISLRLLPFCRRKQINWHNEIKPWKKFGCVGGLYLVAQLLPAVPSFLGLHWSLLESPARELVCWRVGGCSQ